MTASEQRALQVEIDSYFQGHEDACKLRGEAMVATNRAAVAEDKLNVLHAYTANIERALQWFAIAALLEFAVLVCCGFHLARHHELPHPFSSPIQFVKEQYGNYR